MAIEKILKEFGIDYERFDHPAVFTCAQAQEIHLSIPGVNNKNLFLSDEARQRYFLITAQGAKRVDMKLLANLLGVKKLRFGSPEELLSLLNVQPGAVTLLGLIHDQAKKVEVMIDQEVWNYGRIQCHPLINTSTFLIACDKLELFLRKTGHLNYKVNALPYKNS